jgi:integrase
MDIKYTATVKPEKRKKEGHLITENVPLLIDVTFTGQRVWVTTGFRIDASKWDAANQKVKANTTHPKGVTAKTINEGLNSAKEKITAVFKGFEVIEQLPTKEQFLTALRGDDKKKKADKETEANFFNIYNEFIKDRSKLNDWTPSTITKFENIKAKLIEFNPKLTFDKANDSKTLQDFLTFLRDKKDLRNTTIVKQLRFVKTYLKWAYDNNITTNNGYKKFTPNLKGTDGRNKTVVFLTKEEFITLYNFDAKNEHLNHVKDVFCFASLTGLRHSDLLKLKRSDVKPGYIEFTTKKTNHTLKVELNDRSRAILDRYKDIPFVGNKALPVISNQKANEALKTLCKAAGIDQTVNITYFKGGERIDESHPKHSLIGTHTARRTFICLSLYLGIAAETIMLWTGHSSHDTLKPYLGVINDLKEQEMKKFNF